MLDKQEEIQGTEDISERKHIQVIVLFEVAPQVVNCDERGGARSI